MSERCSPEEAGVKCLRKVCRRLMSARIAKLLQALAPQPTSALSKMRSRFNTM